MVYKKGVLKNSQYSQLLQNFTVFTGYRSAIFLKRDSNTGVFLWILGNFSGQLFYRTSLVVDSERTLSRVFLRIFSVNFQWYFEVKLFCVTLVQLLTMKTTIWIFSIFFGFFFLKFSQLRCNFKTNMILFTFFVVSGIIIGFELLSSNSEKHDLCQQKRR